MSERERHVGVDLTAAIFKNRIAEPKYLKTVREKYKNKII